MLITVGVIAYNEANVLNQILSDIKAQDYNHHEIEIVLVDSSSTDNTKSIMSEFANDNKADFYGIQVLDNPKRIQAAGWNVVIDNYKGDALIRIDAHAHIPSDFVRKNVELLSEGEDICGGQRPCMLVDPTPMRKTLLLAENSMFGSSIAPYRGKDSEDDELDKIESNKKQSDKHNEPIYMKSFFHACYRRKVLDEVGHFNENLLRTEDNEMHYRMREAGYKFRYSPDIISYQHTRSSLIKMLKQKFGNGLWIGKTAKVCPNCLSLYHFVPWAFVMAIIISTLACSICGIVTATLGLASTFAILANVIYILTGVMWGAYWLLAIVMAIMAIISSPTERNMTCVLLPFIFFLLHISYGIGTVCGLIGKKPM